MNKSKVSITRRDLLVMGAAAGAAGIFSPLSNAMQLAPKNMSMALFYTPSTTLLWDTWVYHHNGKFYLYYVTGGMMKWNGVGMAVSDDGVHWKEIGKVIDMPAVGVDRTGAGTVWAVPDDSGNERFIMSHSEWQITAGSEREDGLQQTILFSESQDLIHWTRLKNEFHHDTRWYDGNGRWDNIWPMPRPEGGFYGYWVASPKNDVVGIGFGESLDGVAWEALEPAEIHGVPNSSEVSAVHRRQDKCYLIYAGWTGNDFSIEQRTLVGDWPSGPFSPAPKNQRLLVGNASYFVRFVETPDGVLATFHSWETDDSLLMGITDRVYMTPLKRADWDEEGTLRLKWWEGNEKAKTENVPLKSPVLGMHFDPDETLILEGVLPLANPKSTAPNGLYLHGKEESGTAFLMQENGAVDYGSMQVDGSGFEKEGSVDRDLTLKYPVHFRLVRKGLLTEFYLNDYLMQCYSMPEQGTGGISLIGPASQFSKLKAWYCS